MKKLIVAAVLLALLLPVAALAACGGNKVPEGAIAAVGEGVVTQEQFDAIIAQAKAQYESQPDAPAFPDEGTPQFNQLKASIVSYLVQNELIKQEAADMGVSVSDEELEARIKEITEQVGGKKELEKLLEEQGVTREDLEEQLGAQMLQDALRQKITDEVEISEEDAKAFFDDPANKEQFEQPETVDARHVLVKTKAEAEKVQALLEADGSDASWKKVAKQYSTDPGSKENGGSLGSFPKGRMVPQFERVAFSIDEGEISDPVKSQFGWHVIEVTGKTPAATKTFEESRGLIEQQLLFQEQAKAWDEWLKEAREKADIVYAAGFDPDSLTAAPEPSEEPGAESPAAEPESPEQE
jgi:foldase protein PrsA